MRRPTLSRPSFRRRSKPEAPAAEAPAADGATVAAAPEAPDGAGDATTDPHERIDGLRAWLAQVDRRLALRSYAGAALAAVALAAAGAAIYLYVSLEQDAATEDDIAALSEQLGEVEASATQAAEEGVESVEQRLAEIEKELAGLRGDRQATDRELEVVQDDIRDLRSQISGLEASGGSGAGGSAGIFGGSGTKSP